MASAPATANLTRATGRPNTADVAQRLVGIRKDVDEDASTATLALSEGLEVHDRETDGSILEIAQWVRFGLTHENLSRTQYRRLLHRIGRQVVRYWAADAREDAAMAKARQHTRLISGAIEFSETGRRRTDLERE